MRIYIHGNCQASGLHFMLEEIYRQSGSVTIESSEVQRFETSSSEAIMRYKNEIAVADLILSQPIKDFYRGVDYLSLSWIRSNMKQTSKLITFPSMHFRGYSPSSFALNIEGHITNYHDVHITQMFIQGCSVETVCSKLASATFLKKEFVMSELIRSLRELVSREEALNLDLRISPIVSLDFAGDLLFHTFNHPTRRVLALVLRKVLSFASLLENVPIEGRDYLDQTRIPPYSSVSAAIGLPTSDSITNKVTLPEGVFSLLEFVHMSFEHYARIGRSAVTNALMEHSDAIGYLHRHHSIHARRRTEDTTSLICQIYLLILKRLPETRETLYWCNQIHERGLGSVIDSIQNSDEAKGLLSHS